MVVNAITIRGRDQVMIKVTIAEIQRSISKQLGISSSTLAGNWGSFTQNNPYSVNGGPMTTGALNTLTKFGGPSMLTQTLQAFERNGVARTLAEPTVTAVSGESANFTVGGEVPISGGMTCVGATGSTGSTCSAAVTYKTYGVTLNFTPVVLASGRISLRVATEVAEIDPSTSANINGETVPGFPHPAARHHRRIAHRRLDRHRRPDSVHVQPGDQRHAGRDGPADPRRPVPLARLPARRRPN